MASLTKTAKPIQRKKFSARDLLKWTEVVDIAVLKPHPRNPHNGDTDMIGRSLDAHGQFRTIVISSDGFVLMGNHTYMAAMENEIKEMAVVRLPLKHDNLQAIEVMLADNRAPKDATEDEGLLQILLQEIKKDRGTLDGSLYEDRELLKLLREEKKQGASDVDDAPAKPKHPFSQVGQLWKLGEHYLFCGDSTNTKDVTGLMQGRKADMVFTDPPYNADYDGRSDWRVAKKNKRMPVLGIQGDAQGPVAYRRFLEAAFSAIDSNLHAGASVYVCMDWHHYADTRMAYARFWNLKSLLIWDKGHFGLGQHYRTQYEMILFGWQGEKVSHWHAGQKERDVWKIDREDTTKYRHPTQKPVELVERALNNSSNRSHVVLDPFAGSGTTLLACERSGRTFYGLELDPGFIDVICRRWQEYTEELPQLVGGDTHDFTT